MNYSYHFNQLDQLKLEVVLGVFSFVIISLQVAVAGLGVRPKHG